ncbi:hypothetical protein [Ensifer sp. BR816]|uniref:hypothetical protein n=1 Tax=Rhizobium sp. (strain BR816) TaxID=1057002 RepID=UPI0003768D49|nr:hypothetical protein [Ensifer sp. BR816]
MDVSKRNRWRDAALDILMSHAPVPVEMSFVLEALQEEEAACREEAKRPMTGPISRNDLLAINLVGPHLGTM